MPTFQRMGDLDAVGVLLSNLAEAYLYLGDPHRALTQCDQALNHYDAAGLPRRKAAALNTRGRVLQTLNRPDAARQAWTTTLTILDDPDHPRAVEAAELLRKIDQAQPVSGR